MKQMGREGQGRAGKRDFEEKENDKETEIFAQIHEKLYGLLTYSTVSRKYDESLL